MEDFVMAVLYTRSTLITAPLIVFCFLPVWRDAKSAPARLVLKVAAAFFSMETAMFFVYLAAPPMAADNINMCLCIVIYFYLYQREIAIERSHLWFVFMTACMVGGFVFLFHHLVDIFLHPEGVVLDPVHTDTFLLQIMFECLLVFFLSYPARRYLGWLVHHFHEERVWKVIWLIPAGFLAFSAIFIPYDNSVMYKGRFLKVYVITIFVLFFLSIFIYVLFYSIAYSIVEKQDMLRKNANLELQAQQYYQLQSYVQETSRLRHDFRYQLTVLAEMLKKGHYRELEDYLDQYIGSVSDMPVRYCASAAVNAILNHYVAVCRELQITFCPGIHLLEEFGVEDIDFCVLLGNLLENSIDGCRGLPEEKRRITLKMGQTAEHVIALQIANPYEGALVKKEGWLSSSKHEGEGQGLKSVRLITEKYQGFLDVQTEGQVFEVKVLLNF